MLELFEKTLLAGIGTLSLTQKKAEELIDELKSRMNISEEEGKKLVSKLREAASQNQQKLESAACEEIKKACERVGVASASDLDDLQKRLSKLEKQIKELQGN